MLVSSFDVLAQPGQPPLQAPPGGLISEIGRQANLPHAMLPGQPARQQIPVSDNEFAQLIQVLVTGQPLSQLMQRGGAPAGGPLAQLIEVIAVSQPARQPQPGHLIPGVGERADDLDGFLGPGPVGQPA